jgi:hypothetical protein
MNGFFLSLLLPKTKRERFLFPVWQTFYQAFKPLESYLPVMISEKPTGTVLGDKRIYYFLAGWFLVNAFSAYFTELSYDEAYYWMYSRFPAWGYFDHPPMIALMDGLGYAILHDEAGVRLFTILFSCTTILILYLLSDTRNIVALMLIVSSVLPFHMFGFISVPDAPLLLFSALFFYAYKKFLGKETLLHSAALAFAMTGMMYSKYHGIVVIGCTLLSNPRLFLNKKFLLAGLAAGTLYLPHLYWQYTHDFVSLRFHFFDRSAHVYQAQYTLDYLLSQPFFYGPFTGLILFYCAWRNPVKNLFEKSLKYSFVGIVLFFLISTLKDHVEANWTLPILVPMIYFTLSYSSIHPTVVNWLKISAAISIPLFIVARIFIAFPDKAYFHRMGEITGWRTFAREIIKQSDGLPVVANSYQEASKLSFYTGSLIPSLNVNGRHNQFDLWNLSYSFEGKKVMFLNSMIKNGKKIINPQSDLCYLTPINHLSVYQGLQLQTVQKEYEGKAGTTIYLNLRVHSLSGKFPLDSSSAFVRYYFYREGSDVLVKEGCWSFFVSPPSFKKDILPAIGIKLPNKKGKYRVKFSFSAQPPGASGDWGTWKSSVFTVL